MKALPPITLGLACLALLAGCTNPINGYTGGRYYEAGGQAERAGDLQLARQDYYRAYRNAQIGNIGPAAEAYSLYEWSRVTGYLGLYAESEKGFSEVLELIPKAGGGADKLLPPALSEYARLLHDTGQHAKAVPIYEKAQKELEKVGAVKIDALAYASFLDDYAGSLKAAGLVARAAEVAAQSEAIKNEHRGEVPKFEARRYKA